jgi:hypothetical protein
MLVQVRSPHFTAGMVVTDGVVTEAAPILKWAIGKPRHWLRDVFKSKGWTAVVVEENR